MDVYLRLHETWPTLLTLKLQCRQALNESIEDQSQWLRDQDHQPKSTGQNVTSQLINLE